MSDVWSIDHFILIERARWLPDTKPVAQPDHQASSNEGDVVLFAGCATACVSAENLLDRD